MHAVISFIAFVDFVYLDAWNWVSVRCVKCCTSPERPHHVRTPGQVPLSSYREG